jgi:hypothetical protein
MGLFQHTLIENHRNTGELATGSLAMFQAIVCRRGLRPPFRQEMNPWKSAYEKRRKEDVDSSRSHFPKSELFATPGSQYQSPLRLI